MIPYHLFCDSEPHYGYFLVLYLHVLHMHLIITLQLYLVILVQLYCPTSPYVFNWGASVSMDYLHSFQDAAYAVPKPSLFLHQSRLVTRMLLYNTSVGSPLSNPLTGAMRTWHGAWRVLSGRSVQ